MKRLGIFGSTGRMGKAIVSVTSTYKMIDLISCFKRGDNITNFINSSDFIIDFSLNDGTISLVKTLLKIKPVPLLIGTTSLSSDCLIAIDELSTQAPVMHAPNVSIGANLMAYLTKKMAEVLGTGFDAEILDIHHRKKRDAPSGTALMLSDFIAQGIGKKNANIITDRSNNPIRKDGEISISSIRAGSVAAEHIVSFYGESETLSISHKVENRDVFAHCAINVALWLKEQKPGLYTMQDIIKKHYM